MRGASLEQTSPGERRSIFKATSTLAAIADCFLRAQKHSHLWKAGKEEKDRDGFLVRVRVQALFRVKINRIKWESLGDY